LPLTRATFCPSSMLRRKSGGRLNGAEWCSSCPLRIWSLWRVSFDLLLFLKPPRLSVPSLFTLFLVRRLKTFFFGFFSFLFCFISACTLSNRIESNLQLNILLNRERTPWKLEWIWNLSCSLFFFTHDFHE
jgi:hypothetical protein